MNRKDFIAKAALNAMNHGSKDLEAEVIKAAKLYDSFLAEPEDVKKDPGSTPVRHTCAGTEENNCDVEFIFYKNAWGFSDIDTGREISFIHYCPFCGVKLP